MRHRGPDHGAHRALHDARRAHASTCCTRRLSIIDLDAALEPAVPRRRHVAGLQRRALQLRRGARRARARRASRSAPTSRHRGAAATALDRGGWDALDRCEGMWAFADLRRATRRARRCARDRFGEKPLYLLPRRRRPLLRLGGEVHRRAARPPAAGQPRATCTATSSTATRRSTRPRETFFEGLEELAAGRAARASAPAARSARERYWRPAGRDADEHVATRRRWPARASG